MTCLLKTLIEMKKMKRKRVAVKIVFSTIIFALCMYSFELMAQQYTNGKGIIYAYAGNTFANVNTSAVFKLDPTIQHIPEKNTTLGLENDLNFSSSPTVFYCKVLVGGRLQISGSYMTLHRNGDASLKKDFAVGDQSYTLGASVKGYLNTDYFSTSMRLSLLYNPKATAGISFGGGYLRLKAGIDANSNGYSFKQDGAFDVPIIVAGVHGSVNILPGLMLRASIEYFELKYKNTKGKVIDGQISAEYYLLKFLGAGIGYSLTDFRIDGLPENDLYLSDVRYTIKGLNAFVAFRF